MRKRMKRMMGVVLTAAVTVSLLAGCGSAGDKKAEPAEGEIVTLKWYNYLEKVAHDTEKVIEKLNEYNCGNSKCCAGI